MMVTSDRGGSVSDGAVDAAAAKQLTREQHELLTASSADLTRRAAAVRGAKAAPLGLYPLWCAFATALSTHIWVLNRR